METDAIAGPREGEGADSRQGREAESAEATDCTQTERAETGETNTTSPAASWRRVIIGGREAFIPTVAAMQESVWPLVRADANALIERAIDGIIPATPPFGKIQMTYGAYEKAVNISRIIGRAYSPQPEVYLHMVADERGTVLDVIVAKGQRTSSVYCSPGAGSYLKTASEVQDRGLTLRGWCHSHAEMEPFHSRTDDRNLENLVRYYARPETYYIEGDGLSVEMQATAVPSVVINVTGKRQWTTLGVSYRRFGERKQRYRQVPLRFQLVPGDLEYSFKNIAAELEREVCVVDCMRRKRRRRAKPYRHAAEPALPRRQGCRAIYRMMCVLNEHRGESHERKYEGRYKS